MRTSLCLAALCVSALQAPVLPAAEIDARIQRALAAHGIPGAAVAVISEGQVVYLKGHGTANVEAETPVTVGSVFEIASVTKPFTSAAIMLLAESGLVNLDQSIAAYLPDAPEAWREISVRHLLTHTSGLPVDAIPGAQGSALLNISTRAAYDWVRGLPLQFAPGTRASYSDAGYFLLGMIIEQASGQRYREFMHARVFSPLGMASTGIIDRSRILKGRVPVHTMRGGTLAHWRRDWNYELPSFFGMYATAGDLASWDLGLRAGRLLSPATTEQMLTPAALTGGHDALVGGQPYGLGWELGLLGGQRFAGHSGASGVYVLRLLDIPLSVVVLTNLDIATGPHAATLARQIAAIVRPGLAPPESPSVDPNPDLTQALSRLVTDLTNGRESSLMTASYRAHFVALPEPRRSALVRQLGPGAALTYLGEHKVPRPWQSREPAVRTIYCRLEGSVISFDLTAAGRLVTWRIGP